MIRILGLNEIIANMENAGHAFDRKSEDVLRGMGHFTTGRVKAYTLNAGAVDLGELVGGIHYLYRRYPRGNEVVIRPSDAADQYAYYVEHGRGPGRPPPIDAIQGWADRHGIPVWAVATKIAREGTEPRNMWRDSYNDLVQRANKDVRQFADKLQDVI